MKLQLVRFVAVSCVAAGSIAACGITLDVATEDGADATASSSSSSSSGAAASSSSSSSSGSTSSSSSSGGSSSSSSSGGSTSSSSGDVVDACQPRSQDEVCDPKCGTLDNGCGTGTYVCTCPGGANAVCQADQTCCIRTAQGAACANKCGTVSDGCDGTYACGECAAPDECGGGNPGIPNQCGCTEETTAETCARALYRDRTACNKRRSKCGQAVDGCPTAVNCPAGESCVDCFPNDGDNFGCCRPPP